MLKKEEYKKDDQFCSSLIFTRYLGNIQAYPTNFLSHRAVKIFFECPHSKGDSEPC